MDLPDAGSDEKDRKPKTDYIFQLSMIRHELLPHWIFKNKGVLESQDANLELSQSGYMPKNLSSGRTMPLNSSKIVSNNPSKDKTD